MRRLLVPVLALVVLVIAMVALLALPMTAASKAGGLSPAQLNNQGWTCFNVPGLGVHCATPSEAFPFTERTVQLLYFFNTTDPSSDEPDFTGAETLIRDDAFHGQPCPTEPSGEFTNIGDLGGGVEYWACHRN